MSDKKQIRSIQVDDLEPSKDPKGGQLPRRGFVQDLIRHLDVLG